MLAALIFLFNIIVIGLMMPCSSRNMKSILSCIVSCVWLFRKRNVSLKIMLVRTDDVHGESTVLFNTSSPGFVVMCRRIK
jgi:hypothetical protein